MLNLSNKLCTNIQRVWKCTPETFLFLYKYPINENFITRNADIFKFIQIRYHHPYGRPPAGITPMVPKSIPYVRPELRSRIRGGKFMLSIPVVTFGLGIWQIYRLEWKTNLINHINEKQNKDPVPLPLDLEEISQMEFQKVTVTGRFDHEKEFLYGPKPCIVSGEHNTEVISKTGQGGYGFNLVTPFILSDSGERILVNRGWLQTKTTKREKRPWTKTEGELTITGVVRTSEPGNAIAPDRNKKLNVWHCRDIEQMAATTNCLPIYIDATDEHSIPGLLWGGQTRTKIRNEHLSYIITWFSLSAATSYMWYIRYVK